MALTNSGNACRVSDAVVHPGSVLAGAEGGVLERHALFHHSLLQTSRTFAVGLTPMPALPTLLLCAQQVDCDDSGARKGRVRVRDESLLDATKPALLLLLRAHAMLRAQVIAS